MRTRLLLSLICCSSVASAALSAAQKAANLESFEIVWKTVRDRNPGGKLNPTSWRSAHDATRPLIQKAQSMEEVRTLLRDMLLRVGLSHYAIIAADRYSPEPSAAPTSAAPAPPAITQTQPAPGDFKSELKSDPAPDTKTVTFANLPQMELTFESKRLPGGAGYIRFNEFLDPVSLMPKIEKAVKDYADAPGIILDLRGNRGGIGIMASGVAGFFVSEPGKQLGEMTMREGAMKFVIFPRAGSFRGKLAILVDSGSASTTEILAQGLQDLGRARIFGTVTAGAALPSDIVKLPNGDRFQFAEASYTSVSGKTPEGNGVTPDVLITDESAVIPAAQAWIAGK